MCGYDNDHYALGCRACDLDIRRDIDKAVVTPWPYESGFPRSMGGICPPCIERIPQTEQHSPPGDGDLAVMMPRYLRPGRRAHAYPDPDRILFGIAPETFSRVFGRPFTF